MIKGVDRSHLNSNVALSSLYDKGIRFIFFKATQGATYRDRTFNDVWQEAKKISGLCRGAYHFYDPRIDGVIQAKNFLSLGINFSSPGCLAPCVDVEDLVGHDDADTAKINKWVANNYKVAIQRLNDFLDYIKQETGRDCIIYTYNNYPKEYFRGHGFPKNPMWLSSLQSSCPVRYDTKKLPEFWQYTYRWNNGDTNTDMDGDYFTGTQEQLNKLANL